MELGPTFLGRIFSGGGEWAAVFSGDLLAVVRAGSALKIRLVDVHNVRITEGALWPTIHIVTSESIAELKGSRRSDAINFQRRLTGEIVVALKREIATVKRDGLAAAAIEKLYAREAFISSSDADRWVHGIGAISAMLLKNPPSKRFIHLLRHPLFRQPNHRSDFEPALKNIHDIVAGDRSLLRARNGHYIDSEIARRKELFDTVESTPLTNEQRRAAVILEDRNLIVAAAGSGKTSTIVAKVAHLLSSKFCSAAEIIVLAFNSAASEELNSRMHLRLSGRFSDASELKARTFHKLGLEILAQVEGVKPSLAPWASETRDNEGGVIKELIAHLSTNDPKFYLSWTFLRALCAFPDDETPHFNSADEYDDQLPSRVAVKDFRTLNGEMVKSFQELSIANWLFMHSVPYVYERDYEHSTAEQDRSQYRPDFYYPDIACYHEHFALDEHGRAPPHFGPGYENSAQWKRGMHATHKTEFFETTSAEYQRAALFEKLEAELKSRGQLIRQRPLEEVEKRLKELTIPAFGNFLRVFLTHLKSGQTTVEALRAKAAKQRNRFRSQIFVDVAISLLDAYEEKLRAIGCIDFEDMILRATEYVATNRYIHQYKTILIDEFQDISRCRFELIKSLLNQKPECRLFAVGDDWQSIYRFAGSDQGVMMNFGSEFGSSRTEYLTRTFRSNQGIVDVASRFVQANDNQIKKQITATDARRVSAVQILEYQKDGDVEPLIERQLSLISEQAAARGKKVKVFVLGRYNRQRPRALDDWRLQFKDAVDVSFLTLHRSKGLEADFVLIVGLNSDGMSFPSEIGDDPLLSMVMPAPESYPHAEERRLMYVGLTRARHRSYILTRRGRSSPFVRELLTADETVVYRTCKPWPETVHAEPCRDCSTGVRREVMGDSGKFMGCSNFPRCS